MGIQPNVMYAFMASVFFALVIFYVKIKKEIRTVVRRSVFPPLINPNDLTVVSLATIPDRVGTLDRVVMPILEQYRNLRVVINYPYKFRRFESGMEIPAEISENDRVVVNRDIPDYGPGTKLIGTYIYLKKENIKNANIITIDDDQIYGPKLISSLLKYSSAYSDSVICHVGYNLIGSPFRHPNFKFYGVRRDPIEEPRVVQILGGFGGVLYRMKYLRDDLYLGYENFCEEAFYCDDDWFSGIMCKNEVPIVCVPVGRRKDVLVGGVRGVGSALVDGDRAERQEIVLTEWVRRGVLAPVFE